MMSTRRQGSENGQWYAIYPSLHSIQDFDDISEGDDEVLRDLVSLAEPLPSPW